MSPWSVSAEALTTAPLSVGIGVGAELGPRLRLRTSLGGLPGPYRDGIVTAIDAFEPSFTSEDAALVEASIHGGVVWRTELGWRPFPRYGFYVHGVYTRIGLGGSATATELVDATGYDVPAEYTAGRSFEASSTLHLLGPEIGWDQPVWRGLHVRIGVGWSFTVAAKTRLEPAFTLTPLEASIVDPAARTVESEIDSMLTRHAHSPTVTLGVGWAFGPGSKSR